MNYKHLFIICGKNKRRGSRVNLSKSHRSYFKAAKAMAEMSKFKQVKMGCVVVYKHKIISSGCNGYKTNPIQKKYNKYRFYEDDGQHSVHAEVDALLPLIGRNDIDFSHVSLYVYREYKNGNLALARCCNSCMELIKSLGIKNIYYTNHGGYSHEEILY